MFSTIHEFASLRIKIDKDVSCGSGVIGLRSPGQSENRVRPINLACGVIEEMIR